MTPASSPPSRLGVPPVARTSFSYAVFVARVVLDAPGGRRRARRRGGRGAGRRPSRPVFRQIFSSSSPVQRPFVSGGRLYGAYGSSPTTPIVPALVERPNPLADRIGSHAPADDQVAIRLHLKLAFSLSPGSRGTYGSGGQMDQFSGCAARQAHAAGGTQRAKPRASCSPRIRRSRRPAAQSQCACIALRGIARVAESTDPYTGARKASTTNPHRPKMA